MAIMDVINVGQGDCIIINPPSECKYADKCIMIDTGNGSCDITKFLTDKKVILFITHHDKDHFGGFKYFLTNKWDNLEKIVLPFYQNELTLIAKAMTHLKGISDSVDCEQFIDYFNDLVNNQLFLNKLYTNNRANAEKSEYKSKLIDFCCKEDRICNHIKCLNPINDFVEKDYINNETEEIIDEIFEKDFAKEIKLYLIACRHGHYNTDSHLINNLFIDFHREENQNQSNGRLFFSFITINLPIIREFNNNPNRENYRNIFNAYNQTSHDVCTVLKIKYSSKSFLLTGDASKKVFNKLIETETDIESDYLKVPHHGSNQNISKEILQAINPKVAIITHNNRRFGKSKDTHPNWAVLYMLKEQGIKVAVTNDVVKDGDVVIKRQEYNDKYFEIKDVF